MSETCGYFDKDGTSPTYAAAVYAEDDDMRAEGVFPWKNELEVIEGTGLQVKIDSGGMVSRGYWYKQSEDADGASPLTKSIDAEGAGYKRKDRIVVEFDLANTTFVVKVSKGTSTTGTPTAPELVDTSTKWEEGLAIVTVEAGVITAIEDDRTIKGARHKVGAGEIGTVELANGAVTKAKLGTDVPQILKGTSSTAPAGTYPINSLYVQT